MALSDWPKGVFGALGVASGTPKGGPVRKGSAPRLLQGACQNKKLTIRSDSEFSLGPKNIVKTMISVIFQKNIFFADSILWARRGVRRSVPRHGLGAPAALQELSGLRVELPNGVTGGPRES